VCRRVQPLTLSSCNLPCKEQAGNRELSWALVFYTRRLVLARAKHASCCVSPKCALSCPHAEEHRSATRAHVLPPLKPRGDASRSMRANALACPHPSRRAHARSRWRHDLAYALLGMRTDIACCIPHRIRHSPPRSRGAFLRPGFASLLRQAPIEGWRSAEKRSGAAAPVGHAMTRRVRRLRGALRPMTRDARLSALHRGGFGLRGRASLTGICAGSVTASSSHPGHSAWSATSRASRGERLRAAAAGRHASLRIQDRLENTPSVSKVANVYRSCSM